MRSQPIEARAALARVGLDLDPPLSRERAVELEHFSEHRPDIDARERALPHARERVEIARDLAQVRHLSQRDLDRALEDALELIVRQARALIHDEEDQHLLVVHDDDEGLVKPV